MTITVKGMPITPRTLDTMRTGSDDELINGVNIPIIQTAENKSEYNETYKALQNMVDGNTARTKNLHLHAIAQDGHNINDYDGQYDYYYAAYIKDSKGEFKMVRIPTALNEEEKTLVQNIVWGNKDIKKATRAQAIQILINTYQQKFKLFIDDTERNTYKSVWQTETEDAIVTITIKGINSGRYDIKIQACGNIQGKE